MRLDEKKIYWLLVWTVVWMTVIQYNADRPQNAVHAMQNTASSTSSAPALPTDIAGIWQGTLHLGGTSKDLRTEFKIALDAQGGYRTTFYSIDRGGQPMVATRTTFVDGVLIFLIDAVSVKYQGKMSADGKSIAGTWTQGPYSMALNLERTTADAAWPVPEPFKMMASDADPAFDVVTIKPSKPNGKGKLFTVRGRYVVANNATLYDLMAIAYGVHAKQISGAPDWVRTSLLDIEGVPDISGRPNWHHWSLLFQKLLADRFQLKFHQEKKELSVYAITVANHEPKFNKTKAAPTDPPGIVPIGLGNLTVHNETIAEFAFEMQAMVMDKPVVDRTGLTDRYDFTLKWTPDDSQYQQSRSTSPNMRIPAGDNSNAPPGLYTAVREQLGLKIEATKALIDVIVIDHVEKPQD
jgi:uncharacterized protein (TIGR03435 family)